MQATTLYFLVLSLKDGSLQLKRRFDLPAPLAHYPSPLLLHACFAPLISFRAGAACVVSGSESGRVLVFDVFALSSTCPVTHFEGHEGAVADVALSWDESVMASADVPSCAIVWQRQVKVEVCSTDLTSKPVTRSCQDSARLFQMIV